jgi:hypothetical protein
MTAQVDVAVSVYGKPYQTAVTIASLLEHSGQHIDKIYFQEEREQPHGDAVSYIPACFNERNVIHYRPKLHLGWWRLDEIRFAQEDYRLSVRYQLAWEQSKNQYLFIMHNDCLFTSDVIGGMLARLHDQEYSGVGIIGQCWNCPAFFGKVCDGNRYLEYKPSYSEALDLIEKFPSPRTLPSMIDPASPMPLPECRLSEFGCLVNLKKVKYLTIPEGDVVPFSTFTNDTGTAWFRQMALRGHKFLNWHEGFKHGVFSEQSSGHSAILDEQIYVSSEVRAKEYLKTHYEQRSIKFEIRKVLSGSEIGGLRQHQGIEGQVGYGPDRDRAKHR